MRPHKNPAYCCRGPHDEAVALEATVRVTRRAQGKPNPEDVPVGSPEWNDVFDDFLVDLYRAKSARLT